MKNEHRFLLKSGKKHLSVVQTSWTTRIKNEKRTIADVNTGIEEEINRWKSKNMEKNCYWLRETYKDSKNS